MNPDGVLVNGAVAIRPLSHDDASGSGVPSHMSTDPDGRFLSHSAWAERIEITAWDASSPPMRLIRSVGAGAAVDLGDLTLERGASLRGRVLIGGKPSSLGEIELLVRRLDTMASNSFHVAMGRSLSAHALDPGTASVRCEADKDGSWAAEGLSPGRYEVSVLWVGSAVLHDALRSHATRTVEPPTGEIVIDLAACRLDLTYPHPITPACMLTRWDVTDLEGRRTDCEGVRYSGLAGPEWPASWQMLVPASTQVDVWAVAHSCAPWRTSVRTADAGEAQTLAAEFTSATFSRLAVEVSEGLQRDDLTLRLQLFETDTRHMVFEARGRRAKDPVEVPTGTWDAELQQEGFQGKRPSRFHLPQRARVTVDAGRTAKLKWQPPLGARLRIQTADAGTGFVRCTLIRRTGAHPATEFLPPSALDAFYPQGSYPVTGPLLAGKLYELDRALEPGAVTVRLECKGCATFEEHLVLEAGVVTDLLARLQPR